MLIRFVLTYGKISQKHLVQMEKLKFKEVATVY